MSTKALGTAQQTEEAIPKEREGRMRALLEATLSDMELLERDWDFDAPAWEDDLSDGAVAWYIAYRTSN